MLKISSTLFSFFVVILFSGNIRANASGLGGAVLNVVIKESVIQDYKLTKRPSDRTLFQIEDYFSNRQYDEAYQLAFQCPLEKLCGEVMAYIHFFGLGNKNVNLLQSFIALQNINFNTYEPKKIYFGNIRKWIELQSTPVQLNSLDYKRNEELKLIKTLVNGRYLDPSEVYLSGLFLSQGNGTDADQAAAMKRLSQAKDLGFKPAHIALASVYQAQPDEELRRLALEEYTLAAQSGNSDAMFMLGFSFYHGIGTEPNAPLAKEWLQKAANAGHRGAAHLLQN